MSAVRLVAVGSSWGGLHALQVLLGGLGRDFPAAVAVAQHRAAQPGEGDLAGLLDRHSALPVADAEDKDPLEPGRVSLAPPDYHLLVETDGLALSTEGRVRHSRPSVDVLFESAAAALGPGVAAVVLTGLGDDGAAGVRRVRARRGRTIAQDPATAERGEMPRAAIATGAVEWVLALDRIAPALRELCRAPGTSAP